MATDYKFCGLHYGGGGGLQICGLHYGGGGGLQICGLQINVTLCQKTLENRVGLHVE
ncbi:MAG: hypothetical protein GY739_03195 [Mesoflavibacter sp.]|nr:hypothetical protein [Mesoflavibacter sp.]